MLDNELSNDCPKKEGLPPRDRNAEVPEHAGASKIWMGGIIAVCAVLALIMFGRSGDNGNTASTSFNTEPGVTTGSAPATPSKTAR
jgi:hypothetical protein